MSHHRQVGQRNLYVVLYAQRGFSNWFPTCKWVTFTPPYKAGNIEQVDADEKILNFNWYAAVALNRRLLLELLDANMQICSRRASMPRLFHLRHSAGGSCVFSLPCRQGTVFFRQSSRAWLPPLRVLTSFAPFVFRCTVVRSLAFTLAAEFEASDCARPDFLWLTLVMLACQCKRKI